MAGRKARTAPGNTQAGASSVPLLAAQRREESESPVSAGSVSSMTTRTKPSCSAIGTNTMGGRLGLTRRLTRRRSRPGPPGTLAG